ncbi:sporulation protein YjcZ [Brevibacillus agri]|uniref:Sporulation protein YjcZ n=1 Tax=Brevibacillus agri TaxID=51101 RepID=A0A3M8B4C4_9BACL|nr:sporulation protein YjcZ [Brevibacillus agri]
MELLRHLPICIKSGQPGTNAGRLGIRRAPFSLLVHKMKGVAPSGKEGVLMSCSRNNDFALVLVLFVLLVIVLVSIS